MLKSIATLSLLHFGLFAAATFADEVQKSTQTEILHRLVPGTPENLRSLFRYRGERIPIVSAHRGGAGPGYPENCLETFAHTLSQTYAILEVDPRMTRDRQIVLHHDATLERTTTGSGKLSDKTLAEVKQLRLKDPSGKITNYQIPTLDEALEWAKGKTILVLDQKDVPLELRIGKLQEHDAESYAMLIVYGLSDVKQCYALNPEVMMEVMVPDHPGMLRFEETGVPWTNVIAFVGHQPPSDAAFYDAIHAKGSSCIVGTSRNLDREFSDRIKVDEESLRNDYRKLLDLGADVVETDLPRELGSLLFENAETSSITNEFFSLH